MYSDLSLCISISSCFILILGSFLDKLTDLSRILDLFMSTAIIIGSESFW